MRFIEKCHFEDLFEDILRDIEDTFDEEAKEGRAPSIIGSDAAEWLAELWSAYQRLHGHAYDVHFAKDADYMRYRLDELVIEAKETIVLLLLIIRKAQDYEVSTD
jgi:hypothetical protein